jgi:hypothetical protein
LDPGNPEQARLMQRSQNLDIEVEGTDAGTLLNSPVIKLSQLRVL